MQHSQLLRSVAVRIFTVAVILDQSGPKLQLAGPGILEFYSRPPTLNLIKMLWVPAYIILPSYVQFVMQRTKINDYVLWTMVKLCPMGSADPCLGSILVDMITLAKGNNHFRDTSIPNVQCETSRGINVARHSVPETVLINTLIGQHEATSLSSFILPRKQTLRLATLGVQ
jgi:hypothetical protein